VVLGGGGGGGGAGPPPAGLMERGWDVIIEMIAYRLYSMEGPLGLEGQTVSTA
jgi:hypothetical protein